MPTISRFNGILIQMFWTEHRPPHFHAIYAGVDIEVDIQTLQVLNGTLSRQVLALILKWAALHQEELMENWKLCEKKERPRRIQPLA